MQAGMHTRLKKGVIEGKGNDNMWLGKSKDKTECCETEMEQNGATEGDGQDVLFYKLAERSPR